MYTINYLADVLDVPSLLIDYDHRYSVLRWISAEYFEHVEHMVHPRTRSRIRQRCGTEIRRSKRSGRGYEITIGGKVVPGEPLVWSCCTGERRTDIMHMMPGRFYNCQISRLCIRPSWLNKTPKYRAKGTSVVGWSVEHQRYCVVKVDDDYKTTVLSYHDVVQAAIDSANLNP